MSRSSTTILVVDDEPRIRKVLSRILAKRDYHVLQAANGSEALEIIADQDVHLVITDVTMPSISGIDLLGKIKSRSEILPVIMLTGQPSVEAAVECMKIGAVDFISKPFDIDNIYRAVESALAQSLQSPMDLERTIVQRFHPWVVSQYHIINKLGEGNMGVVYLVTGHEGDSDQHYALKIFKPWSSQEQENIDRLRKRFLHEAKAAASVRHPNIIEIVKYGYDEKAMENYILMEYINGRSLTHYVTGPTRLDYRTKAFILSKVADGLEAIHAANILHRDIKPGNILIFDDCNVKITDFGIARLPDSALTREGDLVGSPCYMAPECFQSSRIDHRADIFSLGIMSYELFLGTRPFSGETIYELANRIQKSDYQNPEEIDPDIPHELIAILNRMLQKEADQRYQSAAEIRDQFQVFANRVPAPEKKNSVRN